MPKKRRSEFDRFADDVMILFASLVLTEPLIKPAQMRLAKKIADRARKLSERHRG